GTGLVKALEIANDRDEGADLPVPTGYVRGGMGQITAAMAAAVREQGGLIRTGCAVQRILVEDGRAVGVELADGERIGASVVVSNADPKRTFLQLVDPAVLPEALRGRIRALRADIAPLKFHCALSALPEYYALPDSDLPSQGILSICPDRS